jgi:plastocyanin
VPAPEPNAFTKVTASPCTPEPANQYEQTQYANEGWKGPDYTRYGADCQRLHFAFGPIHVKPGQNDVLLQPVALEKPMYAGYMVRMRPDLVVADPKAPGGFAVPPIEQLHLHHATWLSMHSNYGSGPWFASGEEKTISDIPNGYGMPIDPTDDWELLYMIHNQTAQAYESWITYDIDYVAKAPAETTWGIKPAYPIWLDVGASDSSKSGYPVFNVQRGHGDVANKTCTWPAQNCSEVDPWGGKTSNNGAPDVNRDGTYFSFPKAGAAMGKIASFQGGTIIGLGGHLHPGGLTDNVDLVRGDQSQRIFTSEANYWDRTDPTKVGGPKDSWDMSMTVTGLPRWGVHVQPGDRIRINAMYDTSVQSTYEDMGIVVAYVAPDSAPGVHTAPGLDPLDPAVKFDGVSTDASACLAINVLCDKGLVTHGHMKEASHFGAPDNSPLTAMPGQVADRVSIANFLYTPGDLTTIDLTGIPTVKLGQKLEFDNEDTAIDVYHTVTSCEYPCKGATGIAFPLANSSTVDYDSAELGVGPPLFGPASNNVTWDLNIDPNKGFQSGQTYTYFCRIHPSMRGAFQVTP